ncbi:hypothetical protein Tco_0921576 [Tanacetum coccineum]
MKFILPPRGGTGLSPNFLRVKWVSILGYSLSLYTGGVLEKDPAPHLTARQEQAVQILSSNKAPFRRYPRNLFFSSVGLRTLTYPFALTMGLLDYFRDCDTREGAKAGGGPERGIREIMLLRKRMLVRCGTYLDLVDRKAMSTVVEKGDVALEQPDRQRGKRLRAEGKDVVHAVHKSALGGSSQSGESKSRLTSFYETDAINSEDAKRWLFY